jgi:EAL and modified HD-GYP domain-containing signal transduction protein
VEILEDIAPTAGIIAACKEMKAKGYVIALDDFVYRPEMKPLVDICDIIKIDFRAIPANEMAAYIKPVSGNGVHLLAEKVEDNREFDLAISLGFDFFQGYFFSKPEILKGKEISSSQMTILEIMAEANAQEIVFEKIRALIERDVAVSYKLLRYINSAYYKRINEITSIKQALVILGETEIRRFISMIALAQLVTSKPVELIKASFIRAKFLDLLSRELDLRDHGSELFTLGLFSMIDAILDQPMETVMGKLPLSTYILDALVRGGGELAPYLKLIIAYEEGNWNDVVATTTALNISENSIPAIYLEACEWGSALAQA